MKKTIVLLFSLILGLSFIRPVSAAGEIQLVPAHPDPKNPKSFSFIVITAKPGEEKKGEFAAVNLSDEKKTVKFSAASAIVNDKGEIIGQDTELKDAAAWLKLPEKDETLLPKERKNFPYSLTIPPDAKPGDHVGTIKTLDASLPVWVTIEGETALNFSIEGFTREILDGSPIFKVLVKNSGNTVIGSLGFKIVLTNSLGILAGRKLESFWGEETTVLSNQRKEFVFKWENSLPAIGKYQADLEVSGGNNKKNSSLSFFFINQKAMLGFVAKLLLTLAVLAGIVFGLVKLRKSLSERLLEKRLNNKISLQQSPAVPVNPINNQIDNQTSLPNTVQIQNQVQQMVSDESRMALMKEEDYDKLWFRVRKIVREEIELWKEMENFRKEIKKKLKKEILEEKQSKKS